MEPQDEQLDEVLAALGAQVRRLRTKSALTQEQAAHATGIDYKRWQRIEAGQVNCTVRTLVRIAGVLEVELDELLRRGSS